MKTEYRVAEYQNTTLPESFASGIGTGLTGISITEKPIVQTVGTSLVYRFNWGGTAVHIGTEFQDWSNLTEISKSPGIARGFFLSGAEIGRHSKHRIGGGPALA